MDIADSMGRWLPLAADISPLFRPISIDGRTLPNRIAFQPVEGMDGTEDGAPGPDTVRRYMRWGGGGPALIWFEATAIAPEVAGSAHQLVLKKDTLGGFQRLVSVMKEQCVRVNGFEPLLILQAQHSGRYSSPPQAGCAGFPGDDIPVISDDQLKHYASVYGDVALLAQSAGFDGMDIKASNPYLGCELLGAFTRKGPYGGSFDNRTRFLRDSYRAAEAATARPFFLTSRLHLSDGRSRPYGYGLAEDGTPDFSEALHLVAVLRKEFHIPLIGITSNPWHGADGNPVPAEFRGNPVPEEFRELAGMMDSAAQAQAAFPDLPVVGTGFTAAGSRSPQLAAGMVARGHMAFAGFGRMALAYPGFPRDLQRQGFLDEGKTCLCCGTCHECMRAGGPVICALAGD